MSSRVFRAGGSVRRHVPSTWRRSPETRRRPVIRTQPRGARSRARETTVPPIQRGNRAADRSPHRPRLATRARVEAENAARATRLAQSLQPVLAALESDEELAGQRASPAHRSRARRGETFGGDRAAHFAPRNRRRSRSHPWVWSRRPFPKVDARETHRLRVSTADAGLLQRTPRSPAFAARDWRSLPTDRLARAARSSKPPAEIWTPVSTRNWPRSSADWPMSSGEGAHEHMIHAAAVARPWRITSRR